MSRKVVIVVSAIALLLAGGAVLAQTTIAYGRVTAASLVAERDRDARARGAILGGMLGALATSGGSGGTQAVGTVGGALAGGRLGRLAGTRQIFEYTVRTNDGRSLRMLTDEAGMRIGDCVAVERGGFNNLRLVDDRRCARNVRPTPAEVNSAMACRRAKDQLLAAKNDSEFDRAERRVRLLCFD